MQVHLEVSHFLNCSQQNARSSHAHSWPEGKDLIVMKISIRFYYFAGMTVLYYI